MKLNRILTLSALLSAIALPGCLEDPSPDPTTPTNPTNPQTPSTPSNIDINNLNLFGSLNDEQKQALPITAVSSLKDVGQYPSDIAIYGDYAYVVDSGNNAITRIHLENLDVQKNYVDLGENAMPYAVHATQDAIYVACQGTQEIIKYTHSGDKSAIYAGTLKAPTAVATYQNSVFIADSEYNGSAPMETGGKLVVVDKTNTPILFESGAKNPGFLDVQTIDKNDYLLAVNAGIIDFSTNTVTSKSCLDIWDLKNLSADTRHTICAANASLGRIAVVSDKLYLGDATTPTIHAIELSKIKDSDAVFTDIKLGLHAKSTTTPLAAGSHLVAADFNQDAIVWFYDNKQAVLRLIEPSANPVKGPIDLVFDAKRNQILILNSLSETVDVLKVK